ncbi:MAG: hypothetical protein ACYDA2_04240 [Acidimicrobiales bacterium]
MSRQRIRIKAIKKKDPDVRLYVLALLELAREQLAQEAAEAQAAANAQHRGEKGGRG